MSAIKKQLIIWSIVLVLAVVAAVLLPRLELAKQAGYVLIGWGQWEIELTVVTLILVFVIGFVLFYAAARLVSLLVRLPAQLRSKKDAAKAEAAYRSLIQGLKESAEGNWEKAERALIENAALSGDSLVHYLTAARAAHQRGALRERDQYLKKAREESPDSELAVKLTEAELHLSNEDFDKALQALKRLEKIAPANAQVLRLLHEVYLRLEDWEALGKMLPRLHKSKVLLEAEVRLLELETYSAMLRDKAEEKDAKALQTLWNGLPGHVRKLPELQSIYFAAMIEAGGGELIEQTLRDALSDHWDEPLVVLYGVLELPDPQVQLRHAERWLGRHPTDAILLRILGKIALRAGEQEKAEDYLRRSLELQPTVEAYRLLGDLMLQKGDTEAACECYRRGLMLASKAVIEEIEAHPEG